VRSEVANDFATPVFHVAMFGKSARTAQTFSGDEGICLRTLIDRIFIFLSNFDCVLQRVCRLEPSVSNLSTQIVPYFLPAAI
jgi:hypothetical protein